MVQTVHQLRPFTVGYDNFFNYLDTIANDFQSTKFPPFNIYTEKEDTYILELALAGYSKEHVKITLKEGILTVSAEKDKNKECKKYIHKGITSKSFEQSYNLSDNIIVKNATMIDGMLTITLERVIPEEKKLRTITIS